MSKELYEVIKLFEDEDRDTVVIMQGVTLETAQAVCQDAETSSYTASKPLGCEGDDELIVKWHKQQKHWFYGFRKQR